MYGTALLEREWEAYPDHSEDRRSRCSGASLQQGVSRRLQPRNRFVSRLAVSLDGGR